MRQNGSHVRQLLVSVFELNLADGLPLTGFDADFLARHSDIVDDRNMFVGYDSDSESQLFVRHIVALINVWQRVAMFSLFHQAQPTCWCRKKMRSDNFGASTLTILHQPHFHQHTKVSLARLPRAGL